MAKDKRFNITEKKNLSNTNEKYNGSPLMSKGEVTQVPKKNLNHDNAKNLGRKTSHENSGKSRRA